MKLRAIHPDTMKTVKMQGTDGEKVFAKYITKCSYPEHTKNLLQISKKKTDNTFFFKWAKLKTKTKMGKSFEQVLHKMEYPSVQHIHEKLCSLLINQGNANQNHNEIRPRTHQNG